MENRNEDKELTALAVHGLTALPDEITSAERMQANIQLDIRMARAELADAELNAQANCNADGKNAEMRKIQMELAAAKDPAVVAAREKLAGLEAVSVGAEATYNDLHRRWRAAIAITELQTAKIAYLAKFQKG